MGKQKVVSDKGKVKLVSSPKEETPREVITKRPINYKMPSNGQNGVFAVEYRRKRVSEMYLAGWSQWEIGQELGVSQVTVKHDITELEIIWKEKYSGDIEVLKREQLAKIDRIEQLAMEEYIRSFKAERTVTEYTETNGEFTKDGKRVVRRGRLGDTRYLDQLQWCIEMRAKILGITKEQKNVQINNLMALDWDSIVASSTGKEINDEILQLEALGSSPIEKDEE